MPIEKIPITDREQWLALRQKDVTASIAGALLGCHDYVTAFEMWGLKTGRIKDDPEENEAMKRGRLLEPVAAQLLQEKHPDWKIEDPKTYFRDPDIRLGCTPDRIAVDSSGRRIAVQIKTTADLIFRQKWRDPSTYEIVTPLWIACQNIIEGVQTECDAGMVALMVVGMGLELYEVDVPLHRPIYDRIAEETRAFWHICDSGAAMPPDYARDGAAIARLWSEGNEPPVDLNDHPRMPLLISEQPRLRSTKSTQRSSTLSAITRRASVAAAPSLGNSSAAPATKSKSPLSEF